MRLKVLLAALLSGAFALWLLWIISSKEKRIANAALLPAPSRTADTSSVVDASARSSPGSKADVQPPVVPIVPDSAVEKTTQERVTDRIARLMDLAMTDEAASLTSILWELNNPDRRIREAAVIATVQFGSPDALPALKEASSRTDDPEEKTEILKAIDFLSVRQSQDSAR